MASFVFPLATIPYLARVLGVHQWGLVVFAQAFGVYTGLLVEFGFNLSATRDVARHRDDRERLSHVLAGVLGAKVSLALVSIALAFALQHFLRQFREDPYLLWAGVTAGIAQAFSMTWFYQGLERMRTSAALDVAGKAVGCFGVFLLVHSPAHAARVLAVQAFGSILASSVLLVMAYREVRFRWPSPMGTLDALRSGASMFLFRSAVSLYTTANALILGIFAPATSVAYYAGSEKLTRAGLGVLSPVSQALYPRLNNMLRQSPARAERLVRISAAVMGGGATMMMLAIWFSAPYVIRVALGPGFGPAVPVLRVLALLLPAIALSNVLGIQWMLPHGLDRAFNSIIIICGALNVGVAVILAPQFHHLGMAISVTCCEWAVTLAMFVLLWRKGLNPLVHPGYRPDSLGQVTDVRPQDIPDIV